jgi:hypothetical protein
MAQAVEHLPSKGKDLSLNLSIAKKKKKSAKLELVISGGSSI